MGPFLKKFESVTFSENTFNMVRIEYYVMDIYIDIFDKNLFSLSGYKLNNIEANIKRDMQLFSTL